MKIDHRDFDDAMVLVNTMKDEFTEAGNGHLLVIHTPPIASEKINSEPGDNSPDGTTGIVLAELVDMIEDQLVRICFFLYEQNNEFVVSLTSGHKLNKLDEDVELV